MDITLGLVLLILGIGIAAGIIAGYVGVGGGIIMVPVLLELFRRWGLPQESLVQAAMATSLTAAIFSVGSSTVRHHKHGRVLWKLVPVLAPGALVGGMLGAKLAVRLPGVALQLTLAALLLAAALRMLLEKERPDLQPKPVRWWQGFGVGVLVGIAAGCSGLAGGFILVPAMALLLTVPSAWLAGTSSAVVVWSSLAAAVGYMLSEPTAALGEGFVGHVGLPISGLLALGAIPGAQLGGVLNKKTDPALFRRIFAVLLLVVVVRLVVSAV
ncbi:MAG: sulfite exporter TauE/SafE family protein [bacterium]|nr:sulfite exporter TauE/SafE family protein [bacterium]